MRLDEARALGVQITDPEDGCVELLMEHGPDVIDALLRALKETEARAEAEVAELRSAHGHLARQVDHEGAAQQRTWRVLGGEGSAPNADAVTQRAEKVAAERDALRAIIAGRTEPPTEAEARAHASEGGWWLALVVEDARPDRDAIPHVSVHGRVAPGWRGLRWWPIDATGRPCAWPTTEALDAR